MEQTGCDLILFGQKTPQSLIQQGLEGSTAVGKDEVTSSNLVSSSKMNDPTQFEQVDGTYGLSRVILCLKSLDVTAFLGIDAPWKI